MPASSELTVTLPDGVALHARPAAVLVRRAMRFSAHITVEAAGRSTDAKSILDVLALGATGGTVLTLRAEGEDAPEAVVSLAECVRTLS
jgi:phosphocarrier protein HPr